MEQHFSLFDRVISKPRPLKVLLGIAILLLLFLLIAVFLDGAVDEFTRTLSWRGLLIPPIIIIYILAIAPRMARMEKIVINSFQTITMINEDEYQETINKTAEIERHKEITAISIGIIIGIISALGSMDGQFSWVNLYWLLTSITMYALLIWTIFVSIVSTRMTSTLLRHPLKIDPFNTTPFEPIGRQSLLIALVFIGGITISLIFVGLDVANLKQPIFWLVYIPMGLVPVILFFLTMLPTHHVLANGKAQELDSVHKQLHKNFRNLLQRMENNQDTKNTPDEIIALAVYEKQLKETRTWPYNTAMLRTLFFSVLIPVGTLVGRIIIEALAN